MIFLNVYNTKKITILISNYSSLSNWLFVSSISNTHHAATKTTSVDFDLKNHMIGGSMRSMAHQVTVGPRKGRWLMSGDV